MFPESDRDPFSATVEVEEGENVISWESAIFGKKENKEEIVRQNDEGVTEPSEKKADTVYSSLKESTTADNNTADVSQTETPESVEVKKTGENNESYSSKDPEWGRYYGKLPELENKYSSADKKDAMNGSGAGEAKTEEPFMFPIDLLLWSHGGDGYNPMINTGVKVSYMNMYSVVSVGTDFSDSLYRPLSLGLSAGGFYKLSDFSISADLGYEMMWDFGNNSTINDYALGLRAGLSYNIWSWFAISAGAGVNYSVLKDSNFEDGRFVPMIFGGFEFNLIK
ncbi:MAG TPA: hypothetical protein PLZ43_13875 [bacterium]|nr:hypothetical protein [bacterium]